MRWKGNSRDRFIYKWSETVVRTGSSTIGIHVTKTFSLKKFTERSWPVKRVNRIKTKQQRNKPKKERRERNIFVNVTSGRKDQGICSTFLLLCIGCVSEIRLYYVRQLQMSNLWLQRLDFIASFHVLWETKKAKKYLSQGRTKVGSVKCNCSVGKSFVLRKRGNELILIENTIWSPAELLLIECFWADAKWCMWDQFKSIECSFFAHYTALRSQLECIAMWTLYWICIYRRIESQRSNFNLFAQFVDCILRIV